MILHQIIFFILFFIYKHCKLQARSSKLIFAQKFLLELLVKTDHVIAHFGAIITTVHFFIKI